MKTTIIFIFLIFTGISSFAQTVDYNFHSPTPYKTADVHVFLEQSDGKILMAGRIDLYEDHKVNGLIRLNEDFTYDESFNFNPKDELFIKYLKQREDGNIIIGGSTFIGEINQSGELIYLQEYPSQIHAIDLQNNNKLVLVGSFTEERYSKILRLNEDYSIDTAFTYNVKIDGTVMDVDIFQNKIIIVGYFNNVNGSPKKSLARLNIDGSLDNSLNISSQNSFDFSSVNIQSDGKIILGNGYIYDLNGTSFSNPNAPIRILEDGTVDTTFINNPSIRGFIRQLMFDEDKTMVISDLQTNDNEIIQGYLFRLNKDGSIDESFKKIQINDSFRTRFFSGKNGILISNQVRNGSKYGLTRASKKGIIDNNHQPYLAAKGWFSKGLIKDYSIFVSGEFFLVDSFLTYNLAKLNSLGSIDTSFSIKENFGATTDLVNTEDGSILMSTNKGKLLKISENGIFDSSFNWEQTRPSASIKYLRVLEDNKILISGSNFIERLNANGDVDKTFKLEKGFSGLYFDFDLQSSGEIVYPTQFTLGINEYAHGLIRAKENGSFDPSFNSDSLVSKLPAFNYLVLPNDEIIIGNRFANFQDERIKGFFKLDKNGYFDSTFNQFEINLIWVLENYNDGFLYSGKNYNANIVILEKRNLDGILDSSFVLPSSIKASSFLEGITLNPDKPEEIYMLGELNILGKEKPQFITKLYSFTNDSPEIQQINLVPKIKEDSSFIIELKDLVVSDANNKFPKDFSLSILPGEHFKVSNNLIIPDSNFYGELQIPILVNDGIENSPIFNFEVEVLSVNDLPEIKELNSSFIINNDQSLLISKDSFSITDPDNSLSEIKLGILPGENYEIIGDSIKVINNFSGELSVKVQAYDGIDKGNIYEFKVEVKEKPITTFKITGTLITQNGEPINNEIVEVYQITNDSTNLVKSISITNSNTFVFEGEKDGRFLLKAIPNSEKYTNLLPTYFGDVLLFNKAEVIELSEDKLVTITLFGKTGEQTGNSTIEGLALETEGDEGGRLSLGFATEGNPIPDLPVYLLNKEKALVDLDTTDSNGLFKFENINSGEYQLAADYNNKPLSVSNSLFEITENGQTLQLSLLVGDSLSVVITSITGLEDFEPIEGVTIYPNPVENVIQVNIQNQVNGNYELEILDITGKPLIKQRLKKSNQNLVESIGLAELTKGIYFLKIRKGNTLVVKRLVKG